jgi:hypothetical protein
MTTPKPPKPGLRPSHEISKELGRQREENGKRLREAAPRLKARLDELNREPEDE